MKLIRPLFRATFVRGSPGDLDGAAVVLRTEYAFDPVEAIERKYGDAEAVRVFLRDGFRQQTEEARRCVK